MKTRTAGLLCSLLAIACSPDLMDGNSAPENDRQEAQMRVDIRVSGEMITTRAAVTADERKVEEYDLYVFDVATGELQWRETSVAPAAAEPVPGTRDYRIGVHELTLATAGQKEVFVVANASGSIALPATVTSAEATEERPATQIDDFRRSATQRLADGVMPRTPLAMAGHTFIASAEGATVPVCLGRTVARVSVVNTLPSKIRLSEIAASGATAAFRPFDEEPSGTIATTDYAPATQLGTGRQAFALYLLPAAASQTRIHIKGALDNAEFTCVAPLNDQLYGDYEYTLSLLVQGGKVVAAFTGSGNEGATRPIELSGEWLSGKATVTLPFTPEPNYGFTIGYALNVEGTARIERSEEPWYDAQIVDGSTIRIRTLQENTGAERKAVFTIRVEGSSLPVEVIQQGLADIKTVKFGDTEWMDRAIGATLRANQAYASDIRSFGYLYQWGRTMPFPASGEVECVAAQMNPEEAVASPAFIAWTGESRDWNPQGIEGGPTAYWESVTANPCPAGWRLPTYEELSQVMLYRPNSLIFATGVQSTQEMLPSGPQRPYVGIGSGKWSAGTETLCHYGIKYQGTADAYYVRYSWINTGGTPTSTPPPYSQTHAKDTQEYLTGGENILRIDRLPADASATITKATKKEIEQYWADHESDAAMETLVFPCGGRRDASGALVEQREAAFFWSRSMYSGRSFADKTNPFSKTATSYASGLLYFRPSGRYMFLYAPALGTSQVYADTEDLGYRNQAMQIRCVRAK